MSSAAKAGALTSSGTARRPDLFMLNSFGIMQRYRLKAYGTTQSRMRAGLARPGAAIVRFVSVGRRTRRILAALALIVAVAALGGCGTMPPQGPGAQSIDGAAAEPDSPLVKIAHGVDAVARHVRLPADAARHLFARCAHRARKRAQRSLDVQYYQLEDDATGRLLLRNLRDAAQRGVTGAPAGRRPLHDRHRRHASGACGDPNVEVRLFNPFCCARAIGFPARIAASLLDFGALNHRMHNKLFIADSAMAVVGGRNIADEYFMRQLPQNFVDMDAFVVGAVVRRLVGIFDPYWNSEHVYPIEVIGAPMRDRAARWRNSSRDRQGAAGPPLDAAAGRHPRLRADRRRARRRPDRAACGARRGIRRPARKATRDDATRRCATSVTRRRDDAHLAGARTRW